MAVTQTIAELLISVGVSVEDAGVAAKEIKAVTDAAEKAKSKGGGDLKKFAKSAGTAFLAVGAAALTAGTAIFKLVDGVTKAGDETAKAARRAGLSAEEFQRLAFAAERSGTTTEAVSKAARDFTKNFNEAATKGATPFSAALNEAGLSMQQLAGLSFEDRLGAIGDALNQVEDSSKRTSLAQKLLGEEGGPQLASLLESGTRGIRAMGDEAVAMGKVLGNDALAASEDFQDQMTNLEATIGGVVAQIGVDLIPVVKGIILEIKNWVAQNRDLIRTRLKEFVEQAVPVVRDLASAIVLLVTALAEFAGVVAEAAAVLGIGPESLAVILAGLALALTGLPGLFAAAGIAGFLAGQRIAESFAVAFLGATKLETKLKDIARLQKENATQRQGNTALEFLNENFGGTGIADLDEETFGRLITDLKAIGATDAIAIARSRRGDQQTKVAEREAQIASHEADVRAHSRREAAGRVRKKLGKGKRADDLVRQVGLGQISEEEALAKRKGRGGGGKKPAEGAAEGAAEEVAKPRELTAFDQFLLSKGYTGETGNLRTVSLKDSDIKPQAVVNITNNTFNIDQDISGVLDPKKAADMSAQMIKAAFDTRLARAAQVAQTNIER